MRSRLHVSRRRILQASLAATGGAPLAWAADTTTGTAKYGPEPQPVSADPFTVGVFLCPLWKTGCINGREWANIAKFPERKPVLGWYDEGDPEVTDWEVTYLLDHGISFAMVCWYRELGNHGRPVKPWLGHWLHDGLFRSRYGEKLRFALMWENHTPKADSRASRADLLEHLLPFWIDTYFKRPNYLSIDGKPLLMLYNMDNFIRDLGGDGEARAAVDAMRSECQRRGLKGLVVMGEHHGRTNPRADMAAVGVDAIASYHWPTFTEHYPKDVTPAALIAAQEKCWRGLAQASVPAAVTVSAGWDDRPWEPLKPDVERKLWQLAPAEFATLCRRAKAFANSQADRNPFARMILLDNWNEFGEGHYIFPHEEHGFAYLDAVRDVFCPSAGPHKDLVPADLALGPYDTLYAKSVEPDATAR
jgi:hypothetical protein